MKFSFQYFNTEIYLNASTGNISNNKINVKETS